MTLRHDWRLPLLMLALGWLLLGLLYRDTLVVMLDIWSHSNTYAHAWLVPPLSAWLVWRRRADLLPLSPRPDWPWLLLLLPLGALWLLGDVAVTNAAMQFAFVAMLVVLVPALLGRQVAKRLMFPLGFLFFGVPFGDFLTPWLMDRTADFAVIALRATGIPVFREGLQFIIPSGAWSVVQACSGIRYLMASVMVGTLFAYLSYQSPRKRWLFVLASFVTPVLANWLRAYIIVMLGHLSGNTLAVGVDHLIYGWVFFGMVVLAMFMVGMRWADPDPVAPAPSSDAVVPPSGPLPALLLVTLAAAALLVLPQAARLRMDGAVVQQPPQMMAPVLPGWTWHAQPLTDWQPGYAGARGVLHGYFESAQGERVGLYIGYYRNQQPGQQLITSVNQLVTEEEGQVWAVTARGSQALALPGGEQHWRTADLRGQGLSTLSGGQRTPRLRVWSQYWINGHLTTSDWRAKLLGAWERLQGQGDDAALLVVYADKTDAGGEDALLERFLRQHWGAVDTDLRGMQASGRPAQQ